VIRPFAIRQFVREFVEALALEARRFVGYPRRLEVLEDSASRLVALTNKGQVVVDKATNTVKLSGRLVAPLKAVESVEIQRSHNGDGPELWLVSLRVLRGRSVEIARLLDDTEASILGAKLSTITGKQVVAIR
jgi:hypothetical protein